jgi:capsular polysaccharide biosynthesis protein
MRFAGYEALRPDMFVAAVPRARLLYECGVVVAPDHKLLADVSWGGRDEDSQPRRLAAMHKFILPPVRRVHGRVAVVTSVEANNYYHWMFDILPRFEILQRSGMIPDYYYLNTTAQFQKDSLHALGIPLQKIISPSNSTHIEADELIIPSLLGPPFRNTPQLQACKFLRSAFLLNDEIRKAHRAIYITRRDASSRRVINEAEIQEEVIEHGFEVVSLTDVPFREQVDLFRQARIVVGPHGAGFTNTVFCQPGSVLIEFHPERWGIHCFERLARLNQLEYHAITGYVPDASNSSDDHTVDRAELGKLLCMYV